MADSLPPAAAGGALSPAATLNNDDGLLTTTSSLSSSISHDHVDDYHGPATSADPLHQASSADSRGARGV